MNELLDRLQQHIERESRSLNDEEYVELMDELVSFCDSCAVAKREEMGK